MNLNVVGFEGDGEWLRKYLSIKRPMVLQAMERLGSDTIVIHKFALPRMKLTFGFTIEQLEDEELGAFDRQVDTNDACVILDWMFRNFDPMKPAYDADACKFVADRFAGTMAGEGMADEFEEPEDPIAGKADEFSDPVEPDRFS